MVRETDKAIGISLNGESVRPSEVDMAVSHRSDASQGVNEIPGRRALTFAFNGALQALRIPGHWSVV